MRRYVPMAGLCVAVFLAMTGMGMVVAALPEKYLLTGGDMRSAGWLSAIFALSYMACQYPVGRLADKLGARYVLATGFLLMAASAAVYALSRETWGLYAGRLLQGAGEAPVWAIAPALLGRLYPAIRGRALGFYNAAFHVGLMTGPLAGIWYVANLGGDPFAAFGWLCLVATGLSLAVAGRSPRRDEASAQEAGASVPLAELWPIFASLPLGGAAYGLLTSTIPVNLSAEAGYSPDALGVFFFWVYAGIALSQGTAGRLSDRFGRMPFLVFGLVAMGLGLWVSLEAAAGYGNAPFTLLGLGLGTFAVASLALVNDATPEACRGRTCGLYYLAWGCGYFAGPLASTVWGLRPVVGVLTACACCAALAFLAGSAKRAARAAQQ